MLTWEFLQVARREWHARRREWEAVLIGRRIAKLRAALEKERGMARREVTQAIVS